MVAVDLNLSVQTVVLEQYAGGVVSLSCVAYELIGCRQQAQAAVDLINQQLPVHHGVVACVFVGALVEWKV